LPIGLVSYMITLGCDFNIAILYGEPEL